MYAIIKTSGKQYKIEAGTVFDVDRVDAEVGAVIDINDCILMTSDNGTVNIGEPTLAGSVKVEVKEHFRGPKLIAFKMKRRKRSRVKNGHRQEMTKLEVKDIVLG